MPDFLLEIGCEEIPARMIDAASLELRERMHKLLERERLAARERFRISILPAAWRCSPPAFLQRSPTSPSRSPGRRQRGFQGWPAHSRCPRIRQKSRGRRFRSGESHHSQGRIPFREGHQEGPSRRTKFWPSCFPKKSTPFTGPRICTGASRRNVRAPGALAGCHAGRRSDSAGI